MNAAALRTLNHDAGSAPVESLPRQSSPPMQPSLESSAAIDSRIARVAVYGSFAEAEPHWRALEQAGHLSTPYQAFDFLRLWQEHIGTDDGVTPCIVVGFNAANTPLLLLPFGRRSLRGLKVVEFLGGKHANFNMALWRADAVERIGAEDVRAVLAQIDADLAVLANQPVSWAGYGNPLALLPQQTSPSFGHRGALQPDFNALFEAITSSSSRKKLRRKERILASHGEVRFEQAKGSDIQAVLADFFEQKTARTRAIGLPDVFSYADVRAFIRAAAETPTADGQPLLELYTLKINGVIVATIGGLVADGRFSAMFISIAHGLYSAESPGQQLLIHMVRHCCERGLHTFDLGIGEAKYKDLFCPDPEPMFDSYLPLSASGRRVAFAFRLMAKAKRAIKQRPALWSMILKLRRLKARLLG